MSRTWKHRFASCFFLRSDQLTCNRNVYVNVWKFSRVKKGFEKAKVNSRCFCWFPAAMLVSLRRGTNMASHTKLCNFPWYIFSIMRYRIALWLSHVVYVSLFYNISISWHYLFHGWGFYFLLAWRCVRWKPPIHMNEDDTTNMVDKAMNCNKTRETSKELHEKLNVAFWLRRCPVVAYHCILHVTQFSVSSKRPKSMRG